MNVDERLAAARALIAERRVLEFGYTLPTPSQEENDKQADGEMTMLKNWDLSPVDPHSFDPTEPPGRPVSPPSNLSPPSITGSLTEGSVLTRTTGTWTGTPTYATQWRRGGANIAGATAATYTTVAADVGQIITCAVTATNTGGSNTAVSNSLGPITVAPPTNSVAPVVSMVAGGVEVGNTATRTTGTWTGSPTFTQQWRRNTTNIGGATGVTYLLQGADVGANINCVVTGTNGGGSANATSNNIGPVTEPGEMGRGTGGSRRRR